MHPIHTRFSLYKKLSEWVNPALLRRQGGGLGSSLSFLIFHNDFLSFIMMSIVSKMGSVTFQLATVDDLWPVAWRVLSRNVAKCIGNPIVEKMVQKPSLNYFQRHQVTQWTPNLLSPFVLPIPRKISEGFFIFLFLGIFRGWEDQFLGAFSKNSEI